MLGYTLTNTIEESMKDWYSPLGESGNRHTSMSWNPCSTGLYHCGPLGVRTAQAYLAYSLGDTFTILYDFKEKKVKFYHNSLERDCQDLNLTKLWIGISLYYVGSHVEMIKYEYD